MLMTSSLKALLCAHLKLMALGKAIVSTPTDGLVDVIKDGVTGYLSESDDILAEKVVEISASTVNISDCHYKL